MRRMPASSARKERPRKRKVVADVGMRELEAWKKRSAQENRGAPYVAYKTSTSLATVRVL